MKTQATKLSLVLQNGLLRNVKLDELLNEIENFEGESIKTKKEEFSEIQSNTMSGKSCWEFKPYNEESFDFMKIRQWSENPFTLINLVYTELNK